MRIRDVLQALQTLGKKFVDNSTVTFTGDGIEYEFTGQGLLDLHERSILVSKLVSKAFNEHRIFHEGLEHDLRFVDASQRTAVCLSSLKEASDSIQQALDEIKGCAGSELNLVDMLLAMSSRIKITKDEFEKVPDLDKYNAWVLNIGGDSSEKLTPEEHRKLYNPVIRMLRQSTYPLWGSIIDLLPDGEVKKEATTKFAKGLSGAHLDSSEVEANWLIVNRESLAPKSEGTSVMISKGDPPLDVHGNPIDPAFLIGDLAVDTGISDLAVNIDHYLYGHPKVEDEH